MSGDVTIGALQRLTRFANAIGENIGELIAGQFHWDVFFTGGDISGVRIHDLEVPITGADGGVDPTTGVPADYVWTATGTGDRGSWQAPTGGGGGDGNAVSLQGIPLDGTTPTVNQTIIFDGTQWRIANQGASFSFTVLTFTDANSSPIEIGTGVWKASGALSFSATYQGTPSSAVVSMSGAGNAWSPNSLSLTNSFLGPTVTTQNVNYPAAADSTITFTNSASDGTHPSSATIQHVFNNRVYWGKTTKTSGYNAGDITGLGNSALQGSRARSISVTPGASEYIIYAHPTRYGTATFTVNGFTGGFGSPSVVSITNASGFTENYNVYRSVNANLGATTVVVA